MDDDGPPPIPSRPTRGAIASSPPPEGIPPIPPRPTRARSKSPGTLCEYYY